MGVGEDVHGRVYGKEQWRRPWGMKGGRMVRGRGGARDGGDEDGIGR